MPSFQISYLRHFKNLNSLNLDGNPFCQDANYKPFTIAHLPTLVYLDYRLVDEQMREAANEQYKYSVEEMMQDEAVALRKQEEMVKKEAEYRLHKVSKTSKSSPHILAILASKNYRQVLKSFRYTKNSNGTR